MKKVSVLLIVVILSIIIFFIFGIGVYPSITGIVIDNATEMPIDGAVVRVEWTKTKGVPGLTSKKPYKIVEAITNKDGKVEISGIYTLFVNPPTVVVYKKGYVAWRNDYIFPDYKERWDFHWNDKYKFKLERFKNVYSHSKHFLFIFGNLSSVTSSRLDQAYSWEVPFARREEELLREKRNTKRQGEYNENDMWREVIEELYHQKGENKNE